MDVIGAGHFRRPASFLADQTPAHRKRQMHQLSGEQAVFWRRFGFVLQDSSRRVRLRRSYQYMSERAMYVA